MPAEGGPGTMQVTGQKEAQRREDNGSGHKPPETWPLGSQKGRRGDKLPHVPS